MSDEVNYESWAIDLCSLLDAIELSLSDKDFDKAHALVMGRHQIAESHGLTVQWTGIQAVGIQ